MRTAIPDDPFEKKSPAVEETEDAIDMAEQQLF